MEITCFKNSVLCGELTDFFITINGGVDFDLEFATKLEDQRKETLRDIFCELLDDKYRVTYFLRKPGNYRISILINGNVVQNLDVRGESNDHFNESFSQTERLLLSRIDEGYQRLEDCQQVTRNLRAEKLAETALRISAEREANRQTEIANRQAERANHLTERAHRLTISAERKINRLKIEAEVYERKIAVLQRKIDQLQAKAFEDSAQKEK